MLDFNKFEPMLGTWANKIKPLFDNGEMDKIYDFLKFEGRRGKIICPESKNTFRTFLETPIDKVKVCMLMQDPYDKLKDGIYVADGIAMSCSNTEREQPSLSLFYDAIEDDLYKGLNLEMERLTDLKYLCNQGVMLLNTALTTEMNKSGSHKEIWKPFMIYMLEEVFAKMNNGIIFVLAGQQSQYYAKYINPLQHYIIEVEHPAAASYKMRKWQHEKIFSKINYILKTNSKSEVDWIYEKPPF